jgi:hypothetical protein
MFWSKKRKQIREIDRLAKLVSDLANLNFILAKITYLDLSAQQKEISKIITYVFFDVLCGTLVGKEEKNEDFALIGGLRNLALKIFDDNGLPQYLVDPQPNESKADVSKYDSAIVYEFLNDNPLFSHLLISKVNEVVVAIVSELSHGQATNTTSALSNLMKDEAILKSMLQPKEITTVSCAKCGIAEHWNSLNKREDSKIFSFKMENNSRQDGLEVYSLICFQCESVTDFALDPFNFSGNASDGVEYFGHYSPTISEIEIAIKFAKEARSYQNIDKLNGIKIR